MRVFGKTLGEYVRFTGLGLALIAGVTLLRLVLSLAGVSNASVKWLSGTVVTLACALIYSALVHTKGFGSYKQILPVVWLQSVTFSLVVVVGIVLAIATGQSNIFTAPEYSGGGDGRNWMHVFAHVILGGVIAPLVVWGLGSLVLLVTKKLAPASGSHPAAA